MQPNMLKLNHRMKGGRQMEIRIKKITKLKPSGTAGKGSKRYRVELPSVWIEALGMDESLTGRFIFDGKSIKIEPAILE